MNQEFDCGDIVRRFGKYNEAQIMQLKEILQLQMSYANLFLCATYYGTREKRDPTVEELKTLDRLSSLSLGADDILLTELLTNEGICACTYADMMNKRRELRQDTEIPLSLGEAARLATAYLERIGKSAPLDEKTVTLNQSCALIENAIGASNSPVSVTVSNRNGDSKLCAGDSFMLLHRGDMPFWKYDSLIAPLLASDEIYKSAKVVLKVPKEGLLPMLTSRFDGVCYDLGALSPSVHSKTIEYLIGKFTGYYVLVLPRESKESVASLARRMGFRPIVFATATTEMRTSFLFSQSHVISYETSFLHILTQKKTMVAKLPREDANSFGKITHTSIGLDSCRYLDSSNSNQGVQFQNGVFGASARGKLDSFPYRTALMTALTAILSTVGTGCADADNRIAVSLSIPSLDMDETRAGQILSAILGIYRLQCELAIPSSATEIFDDDTLTEPEICIFSLSPKQALPSSFVQNGSKIYCVSPVTEQNGLPNFDALRNMIRELSELCKQGSIKSVRVLCNARITDAVQDMETDHLTFHLTDGAALAGEEIPLAILLESGDTLPFTVIGSVTKEKDSKKDAFSPYLPVLEETLNRGDAYEVLILSKQTDVDALNLTRILEHRGARCTNLFDSTPDGIVARAIMVSQLVILCGEYAPVINEQTSFAIRVLHEAGGRMLRIGNHSKITPDLADFTLENGITEEILSRISLENS